MIRFFSRPRSERGAVAIMVAALAIVLFGVAALGVDIASQVNRKHLLKNQLDAAATAAAYYLDVDTTGIKDAATNATTYFAKNGQGTLDPTDISFWCVVARKLNTNNTPYTPAMVANYQIPSSSFPTGTCNPDAASATTDWKMSDYQSRVRYDGTVFKMSCNSTLCAVPCALQAKPGNNWSPGKSIANNKTITCNTIRVGADQNVPFSFAPVLGIDQGSTGAQIAVACKGSCGAVASNPMNVVVVTDRTASMSTTDETAMITGIKAMLQKMSPEQQFVSLGTIGRSAATSRTAAFSQCNTVGKLDYADNVNSSYQWVPLKFHNNYLGGDGALNNSSNLVKALTCLDRTSSTHVDANQGTFLAAPFKAAARYVSGIDTAGYNVESELNGSSRTGTVRNLIIFETDGQPFEYTASSSSSQLNCGVINSLRSTASGCGNGYDVFSDYRRTSTASSDDTANATTNTCVSGTTPYSGASSCQSTYGAKSTTCSSGTLGTANGWTDACWTKTTKYTTSRTCANAGYSWGNPTSGTSACYQEVGSPVVTPYTITYKRATTTDTTTNTVSWIGGQQACSNFNSVASAFKADNPNNLVITVGYNLNGSTLCGGNDNSTSGKLPTDSTSTSNGTAYLSNVTDTSGNAITSTCATSTGDPKVYTFKSGCNKDVILTYSVTNTVTRTLNVYGSPNPSVPDVLASAAGGQGITASTNNNDCSTTAGRAAENADGDYFFCAASGDDMGSIFVTALSQVSSGIKLINIPSGG